MCQNYVVNQVNINIGVKNNYCFLETPAETRQGRLELVLRFPGLVHQVLGPLPVSRHKQPLYINLLTVVVSILYYS